MAGRIELLDYDEWTGGRTVVHFDQDGEGFVIEETTDVQHVAEHAQHERNAHGKHPWKGAGALVHAARIPLDIYHREVTLKGRSGKDLLKWLDDKDYGALWKTIPGRLV